MKLEALDHPKTLDLASRLNISLPTVIGHLELLWAWTGKKAAQGNVGKWPDGAIARACFYEGDASHFVQCLVDAGFLDRHPDYRLLIHDWQEHAPRWVKSKLSTERLSFISADTPPKASGDVSRDTSDDSKGRVVKGSEGKDAGAPLADGVDALAWGRWVNYRSEIRKPIKPASMQAAQRKLAGFGADQIAVVEQTIANGWQGLFELKAEGRARPSQPQRRVDRRAD